MSTNIIQFPQRLTFDAWNDSYWGVCPECNRQDNFLDVGRAAGGR